MALSETSQRLAPTGGAEAASGHWPQRSSRAVVYVVLVAIVAVLVGLMALSAYESEREHADAKALADAQSAARALEDHITDSFDRIDLALRTVAFAVRRAGVAELPFDELLDLQHKGLPDVDTLRIADANGTIIHASRDAFGRPALGMEGFAKRDFFTRPRDDLTTELVVTGPVFDVHSGQWSLVLSRRLSGASGGFAGVVYAVVGAARFDTVFAAHAIRSDNLVDLRTMGRVLVARFPATPASGNAIGKPVDEDLHPAVSDWAGSFRLLAPGDGTERVFAYRNFENYPFQVMVGRPVGNSTVEVRQRARMLFALGGLIVAFVGVASWINFRSIARRARAEQARAASEARLGYALDAASDGVWDWHVESGRTYCSPAYFRMLGYPASAFSDDVGKVWIDLLHPAERDDVLARTRALLAAKGAYELEFRMRAADGVYKWILSRGKVVERDAAGHPLRAVGTHTDLTARKELEIRLRNGNEEQSAIFDTTIVGIAFARNQRIVRCNRRLAEILESAPEDMPGRSTESWYEDEDGNDAGFADVWHGKTYDCERRLTRKDGGTLWVQINSRAVDPGNPARGVVTTMLDITARHEAADALRLASDEQRAIFDAATVGVVLFRRRRIVRHNRKLEEIFGYRSGELDGLSANVWYADPAICSEVERELSALVVRGETYQREQQLVRKDGNPFWARMAAKALDPADPAKGMLCIIEDITVEREAKEALRNAKEIAEAAAQTKADFLANMSHEIRTPMNAVLGMSQLLLRTQLSARQRDYLQKLQGAGQHLLGIINDVLDFSKVEAGRLEIERVEFNPERMLNHVAVLLAERSAAKGLELVIDLASDVPRTLVGDELRLRQVLVNLGSNAVKFTDSGEIDIVGRVQQRGERELVVRFSVRDTGIGLTEEQKPLLFRSFQQADSSTTRKYGGTGLGLAISRRLTELMGGEIGFESEPGSGSTFWFTVPLGVCQPAPALALPAPDLRGCRALVVDDNATARRVLRDMLADMTFAADEAASGDEAVDAVRQAADAGRPYAIVFIDSIMAGRDGIATLDALNALGLARPPRVVMLTPYGREGLAEAAMRHGAHGLIAKPATCSLLLDTAIQALQGLPAAVPAAPGPEAAASLPEGLRGARILVVEDNLLNQEVADALLTSAGFVVDVADNGAVAVRKVQEAAFDLVFMDMQMPVMDGMEATAAIRRLADMEDLPIVAMTANTMREDRDRCFAAGMNDFITKPIDPELMRAVLVKWIRCRPASLPAPAKVAIAEAPAASALAKDPDPGMLAIAGIDIETGLRRVGGNRALYVKLLRKFAQQHKDAAQKIRAALAETDTAPAAERLAHTIKGLAGTLGAVSLQALALRLEQAIASHASRARLESALDAFEGALAMLVSAIAAQLPAVAAASPGPSQGALPVNAVLADLARLMRESDPAARELFEAHQAALQACLGNRSMDIACALEAFDFDAALEALEHAAVLPMESEATGA